MAQILLPEGLAPSTPAANTVALYSKAGGQLYSKDDAGVETQLGGGGSVSSVDITVPTGLSVSGNPITSSGTFVITYTAGYSLPTTTSQTDWDTAFSWGNYATAIGVTIQAYDADTAKTDVAQNFTLPQRAAPTADNDLSFDLAAKNNFTCTPTALGTLTFTGIGTQSGQTGVIKLVNGSNYAISAHANTKITADDLAQISLTGTYLLTYFCDGTDVLVVASGDLS
jgi:hypothetical protein